MPMTFDRATVDGAGAFLAHKLERLDQTLNLPLVNFIWSCDIQLCEDVSIVDEISSLTNIAFVAVGTPSANGKNWLSKVATATAGLNVSVARTGFPLTLWGMELGWTVPELQAVAQVGRPTDTQKYGGTQLKWNADTDEQVYIGDSGLNAKGLLNLAQVTPTNAAKTWATSTADEIRASINAGLSAAWVNSVHFIVLTGMLILPEQFFLLASIIVSNADNQSLLTYLETNVIAYYQNGRPLNIRPVKWTKGRGVSNSDRMMFYTNDRKYVCFPMIPLMSVPIQYRGLYQFVAYYGKLGAVEPVYPETLVYVDGI